MFLKLVGIEELGIWLIVGCCCFDNFEILIGESFIAKRSFDCILDYNIIEVHSFYRQNTQNVWL